MQNKNGLPTNAHVSEAVFVHAEKSLQWQKTSYLTQKIKADFDFWGRILEPILERGQFAGFLLILPTGPRWLMSRMYCSNTGSLYYP